MKRLLLQAIKFVGLSGIGWILDFCIYMGLGFVSSKLFINNIISSWAGVTFVFVFSTRKIFQNNSEVPLKCKYMIYILYQCVLILLISKLLNVINIMILNYITIDIVVRFSFAIAKIFVTPITMVLNFLVMKSIMERI
ncbi:hypothetical protein DXB18_14255 [Clostridium sp. OM02-18AC]|nr:hypothetical protein DXB18_14255 [Clostridium sp. OM02-18AC]